MKNSPLKIQIETILKAKLAAQRVVVTDDSDKHAGHREARMSGGGHFRVMVVSEHFAGKSPVARHRLVYQALGEHMKGKIHALGLTALTPMEFQEAR
jgi:BolA protein